MDAPAIPKTKGYLRRRGWKDLIFLAVVFTVGYFGKLYLVDPHAYRPNPVDDLRKWKLRPQLSPGRDSVSQPKRGESGMPACFFIVPQGAVDQPVVSGSVDDCRLLIPDGKKLDLFEVALVGSFLPIKTDLYVQDVIPLAFTRTYRPIDDWCRRFRVYVPHVYDPYLFGDHFPYTYAEWDLPDVLKIYYRRVSPGGGYADAVFENDWRIPIFGGSRINWNGYGWDLAFPDGTTYLTPEAYSATRPSQSSLVAIFDKEGREVELSREPNGDLTEIKSPSGGWIRLTYDRGRIFEAKDSLGNVVEYDYDSNDRLGAVRYSTGRTIRYLYDSSNRIIEVEDSLAGVLLQNKYDSDGLVIQQIVEGRRTYSFRYAFDKPTKSADVDIVDSRGEVTRVKMRGTDKGISYTVEKLARASGHH